MLLGEHVLFDRFCLSLHLPPLLADWFLLLLKTLALYIWLWHTAPRRGLQAYQGGCLDGSGFCCVSWDCAAKLGRVVLTVNPCEGRRSGVCLWDGISLQQPRPIQQRSFWRTAYEQAARLWRGAMLLALAPARVGSRGCSEISACQCWLRTACKVQSTTSYRKLDIICVLWNIHEVQGTDFRCCRLAHLFHVLCTHWIRYTVVLHSCWFTLAVNVTSACLHIMCWSFSSWQLPGCFLCCITIENRRSYRINLCRIVFI